MIEGNNEYICAVCADRYKVDIVKPYKHIEQIQVHSCVRCGLGTKSFRWVDPDVIVLNSIPMILHCPYCTARHIDVDEFATKSHHTHACQKCGGCWRPAIVPTVGVQFLPGFKNTEIGTCPVYSYITSKCYLDVGHSGPHQDGSIQWYAF